MIRVIPFIQIACVCAPHLHVLTSSNASGGWGQNWSFHSRKQAQSLCHLYWFVQILLSKLVLLLVFIFIILTFLNRVWIYSNKGEDRQPLPFPEYVFKGRSWVPLHLFDRLLRICGNRLLALSNFALGQLNIDPELVRVENIVRILLLGLLLWMQELASEAVRTIEVLMVLFA